MGEAAGEGESWQRGTATLINLIKVHLEMPCLRPALQRRSGCLLKVCTPLATAVSIELVWR